MSEIRARPLSTYPGQETPAYEREEARFRRPGSTRYDGTYRPGGKTPIEQTMRELEAELDRIDVDRAVLEVDVPESRIRRDGWIYAASRPSSPRVVLSFDHPQQGPVRFPCDTYTDWRDNVRAIRLTLEALRAIARYGVAQRAEQYRGWTALPAESSAGLNAMAAARVLVAYDPTMQRSDAATATIAAEKLLRDQALARMYLRRAAVATHPDAGGSTEAFQAVQSARRTLSAHFGVPL